MSPPPIVLTTDFGIDDPYVGVMKGVILRVNPEASVVDLTHHIQPQNVRQGAFVLGSSYRFFPHEAIHVVVVDPGVGTDRRAILLNTPGGRFLAPDNGVLSWVIREHLQGKLTDAGVVEVPTGLTAYELTNDRLWLHPVSKTFHGRDIFAPVAAHLSLGVDATDVGTRVDSLCYSPFPEPTIEGAGVEGEVIFVDRFGNLITNIAAGCLPASGQARISVRDRAIDGIAAAYHSPGLQAGKLLALVGSHGHLEIAVADGSAADALGASEGERVSVTVVGG